MSSKRLIVLILMFLSCRLFGITVGSDTSSSKQKKIFFQASDDNNQLIGFTVFEGGFSFENSSTTCVFNAFFPISGSIALNGGTLFLARDTIFNNPFRIGAGKIDANFYSIKFPSNVSNISLPSQNHTGVLSFVDEATIGDDVYDISWSHDDKYVAVACDSFGGSELQVFYFDGTELTLKDSYNFGYVVDYTVDWHPSDYYLAVGISSGDELLTFSFNPETEVLAQVDTKNTGKIYSVAWSPDGQLLAAGRYNQNDVQVYEVEDGVLGYLHTCTLYTGAESLSTNFVQRKGLTWHSSGNYLATTFYASAGGKKYCIKVFSYNGSYFTDSGYFENSDYIRAIDFKPESSLLVAGFYRGSQRLRLYYHNPSSGTITELGEPTVKSKAFEISELTEISLVQESRAVYDVEWSGSLFAYLVSKSNSDYELKICSIDSSDNALYVVSGYNYTSNLNTLSWSNSGNYIATGGPTDKLIILEFLSKPLIFKDAKLYFDSDVLLTGSIIFEGSCILNCGRNILDISSDACITVTDGATLLLEDVVIKGLATDNIKCTDDDGIIQLDDVIWVQEDDFNFSNGALKFKNDVKMMGDYIFAYQTIKTSTLLSRSTLALDVGFTFSYNPTCTSKDLIEMTDNTSLLLLNGATLHTTVTGMQLTKGKLRVLRDSFLSSEVTSVSDGEGKPVRIDEGITFGADDADYDLSCDILSGVTLYCLQGSLNYKNISSSSWQMNNFTSVLHMYSSAQLNVYQNLNLGNGSLFLGDNAIIGRAIGKDITGSLRPQGTLLYTNV